MHIYFSGIGGSGLSALAHIALDAGYKVSGSDVAFNTNTASLAKRGVQIADQQSANSIKKLHKSNPIDWLVISSAIPGNHPEVTFANEHTIPATKREALINHLLTEFGHKLIAISGTHGKTTTTAMVVWLMRALGQPVSWLIGANLPFGPSGHLEQQAGYFVLEADEYDRHMLHYKPQLGIISSLDYDHPDIYPTQADYYQAFEQFASQSQQVVIWQTDAQKINAPANCFALPDNHDHLPVDLPGEHNRRNGWLAAKAVELLGLLAHGQKTWHELLAALANFPGTERRFEQLAPGIVSDYAHHPAEIAATLAMAQEYRRQHNLQKIIVIYQPHQDMRQRAVAAGYQHAFDAADEVWWLPTYEPPGRSVGRPLPPAQLIKHLSNPDKAHIARKGAKLAKIAYTNQAKANLVIIMGAGDIDSWARQHFKDEQ